jgi:radical SAM superfamily enzyme YgiQ (UPF0313 family)
MSTEKGKSEPIYQGFEQGPIRPPSEAASLLLRITRNCPWNRCTFCSVYKREKKFSLRPVSHVLKDIDAVSRHVEKIVHLGGKSGGLTRSEFEELAAELSGGEQMALYAAANWVAGGMKSIFLQDGDSLVVKPDEMVAILQHIRSCFPGVERVTSYARSRTIDRITDADLARIREAGLNRIHIGMESGSDKVLELVRKGVDKATHIRAGQKVKRAGMELSEYVMPGLGGRGLSREHALETADALNQIDADFIRLRTLAIPKRTELLEQWKAGTFEKLADREMAEEILLFLENLDGITSTLKSDHILNLFQEIEGTFPQDKTRMTGVIRRFFALPPQEQVLYMVGRRTGIFSRLDDLADPNGRRNAQNLCERFHVTPENVDTVVMELIERFI